MYLYAQLLGHVCLFVTPWTIACKTPSHGIFQARILEQVAVSCSRRSFWPKDGACISYVSCVGMWLLCHCATRKLKHVNLTIAPKSGNKTLPEPGSPPAFLPIVNLSTLQWVILQFSSVQSLSCVRLFVTPWTTACQVSLSITSSWSLPKLMFIELVMPSSHLILCRPLLLPPSISPSIIVFSKESVLHMGWPKYWHFSFSISPSNEHPGLISFRMDWLDLLAVQGTLRSLLQYHSSKASILWCSAFFIGHHLWLFPFLWIWGITCSPSPVKYSS